MRVQIVIGKNKFYWSYKKFLINLLVLGVVIGLSMFMMATSAKATQEAIYETVTVRSGDTLWSIAKRFAPETDPRITIAKIKELNQLEKSNIQAGQILKVQVE
ncbi:MAG TPA: LysM peptidoglycan-binding domain-containing protein [Bacillota bacterium]|jgi:uncharacterized membrane protein|nr:LysM peptidoglycan-binding domain-containing protein [Bacillota bacterium]HOL10609.1 LysM peptidoglycan-binding domain-containing protein [Bacillota bacterium]HPO98586.1 LysM peptidoglycan-binding domain-containing protein [Bacillota bacterium]